MNITQQKGITTELECQLELTKLGYLVSTPITQDSRYDLIVEINYQLYKIQVKTSRDNDSNNEGFIINTCSTRMNHTSGNIRNRYSKRDVDFFATFYKEKMYLIPIELCTGDEKRLVKKNNKFSNNYCDLMENYEVDKVIQRLINNEALVILNDKKYIKQYTLDNIYVNQFNTFAEASRAVLNGSNSGAGHISDVTKGRRQSAYNYIWRLE